jgi:hypothetical protein
MNSRVALWPPVLLLCILLTGCEPPPPVATAPSGPPAPPPPPGAAPPPPPAASSTNSTPPAAAPLPIETKVGGFAGTLDDLAARPATPPSPPATSSEGPALGDPNVERVKAEKGVGIQGRSLDQYEGVVVTPVKTLFAARERAFFEIEFPGNYRTWRASEDKAPKDFDDLKARFLDPLGLTAKMPKLPAGHKYVWDAEKEELMVERPKSR